MEINLDISKKNRFSILIITLLYLDVAVICVIRGQTGKITKKYFLISFVIRSLVKVISL